MLVEQRAHAQGLMHCGKLWLCPTCSARIRARRESEIERALTAHTDNGGRIAMLTLTLRHSSHDPLKRTLNTLQTSWAQLQRLASWRSLRDCIDGQISTLEITTGSGHAGWHPHQHTILLVNKDATQSDTVAAAEAIRHDWARLANDQATADTIRYGLDILWMDTDATTAARYVTKNAKELTQIETKNGNEPFSLLDPTGDPIKDAHNLHLFEEYAHATRGRQCHRWSNGLKKRLLPDEEDMTDEQLAEDNDAAGESALVLSRELWNKITESERLSWLEFAEAHAADDTG